MYNSAVMSAAIDIVDTAAIEAAAVEFAQGAGDLLAGYFGRVISVEYKDKAQQDPVTAADKETQAYLERRIAERFPTHGILGEEDDASADGDNTAADFLWVLDPLDGHHQLYERPAGVRILNWRAAPGHSDCRRRVYSLAH